MNLETVVYKLQRGLDKRIQQLAISVTSGGVDSMETYKYIIGQINALEATKQEISNLLNEKEQNEGTIVDIKRNGKDPLTK
jgi:predicted ATP-dependent protease